MLTAFLGSSFFGKGYFWATLAMTVAAGFYYWSLAKTSLARNWQEAPTEDGLANSGQRRPMEPPTVGHLRKPRKLCGDTPPAYWLFARYGDTRQVGPLPIGVCFATVAGLMFLAGDWDVIKIGYPIMMGAGRLTQMLAMAKIAPQSFAEIARPGAMEILQTTPITLKDIVRAAYRFLLVHFVRGVLPMLALDALVLLMFVLRKSTAHSDGGFTLMLLAHDGCFLSGLCAMGVAGIWLGLKQRSLTRASLRVTFYFLILPAIVYVVEPASPALITVVLIIVYLAIAALMHRMLSRLADGGDAVQRLGGRADG